MGLLRTLCILTTMLYAQLAYSDYLFLNTPESVRKPGYHVFSTLEKDKSTRIFFHYCNKTHAGMYFIAIVDMYDAKFGYAVDYDPGVAGAKAVNGFNNSIQTALKDIKIYLPKGDTLSGIIEGKSRKTDWVNYFNYIDPKVVGYGLNITSVNGFAINDPIVTHVFNMDTKKVYFEFGNEKMNLFNGSYGITHRFDIHNVSDKSKKYIIKLSPRGGNLIFAYKTVSQNVLTPILLARRWYDLETITLKPGENWWLEDIITGGFNYPVAIAVVPVL